MRVDLVGLKAVGLEEEETSGGVAERDSGTNRRRKKKTKQLTQMPTAVRKLYRACRDVFSNVGPGVVPPPEDVDRIRAVLDKMNPSDLNVSPNMPCVRVRTANGAIPITYLHVYECDNFSIGIFCLPPSGVIPLHNHPGMTVFSKLLFGSMRIKSYDWVDVPQNTNDSLYPTQFQPPGVRLAKVNTDSIFTAPCNTSILYPAAGGNMHCFTAQTACAVLDVLGPPYSDPEGRHCTYYNDYPYESISDNANNLPLDGGEYAWLEEKEKPEDFVVMGAKYTGPRIVEH